MSMALRVLLTAVVALSGPGCGSSAGAGSCTLNTSTYSYCTDYTGSSYTASATQAACPASVGTYSARACATGAGGVCTFHGGTSIEYRWTFASADAGAGVSESGLCAEAGGTYEAH